MDKMTKFQVAWAFIVANKKWIIPIVVILAVVVLCSVSYTAGCVNGVNCGK